jgi:hypothetical protein
VACLSGEMTSHVEWSRRAPLLLETLTSTERETAPPTGLSGAIPFDKLRFTVRETGSRASVAESLPC